jgi:DNA-binding MurR/RpiR family transcriptional regulator
VIGITDGPMSPLHEAADICLSVRTDMASFVDSMAAPMSVINALIVALGIKNREIVAERFKQLEEVWDAYSVYMNESK